jgi:hypothetical protein
MAADHWSLAESRLEMSKHGKMFVPGPRTCAPRLIIDVACSAFSKTCRDARLPRPIPALHRNATSFTVVWKQMVLVEQKQYFSNMNLTCVRPFSMASAILHSCDCPLAATPQQPDFGQTPNCDAAGAL